MDQKASESLSEELKEEEQPISSDDVEVETDQNVEEPIIPEVTSPPVHDTENLLDSDDDEDLSTQPTTIPEVRITVKANKHELFERYLSFLETEEELNPVLCGYFSKVFTVLVGAKTKQVFSYVYTHTRVLDNLIRHSYQKSIAEVLIRLLNT